MAPIPLCWSKNRSLAWAEGNRRCSALEPCAAEMSIEAPPATGTVGSVSGHMLECLVFCLDRFSCYSPLTIAYHCSFFLKLRP